MWSWLYTAQPFLCRTGLFQAPGSTGMKSLRSLPLLLSILWKPHQRLDGVQGPGLGCGPPGRTCPDTLEEAGCLHHSVPACIGLQLHCISLSPTSPWGLERGWVLLAGAPSARPLSREIPFGFLSLWELVEWECKSRDNPLCLPKSGADPGLVGPGSLVTTKEKEETPPPTYPPTPHTRESFSV